MQPNRQFRLLRQQNTQFRKSKSKYLGDDSSKKSEIKVIAGFLRN